MAKKMDGAAAAADSVTALGHSLVQLLGDASGGKQRELTLSVACCLTTILRLSAYAAAPTEDSGRPPDRIALALRLSLALDGLLQACDGRGGATEVSSLLTTDLTHAHRLVPSGFSQIALVRIAEQLEQWTRSTSEDAASPASSPGRSSATGADSPNLPGSDSGVCAVDGVNGSADALASVLRRRLSEIRAAGPGEASRVLAAEDEAIKEALSRRLEARRRSREGGWLRMLGWFLTPAIPCVVSMVVAQMSAAPPSLS